MLFYTIGQIYVFLAAILAGILIGIWYDILCAVRRILAAGIWLSLAADIAFGLGAGVITIACIYASAYGEVRLYSILGIACGCLLYFGTASRMLRAAWRLLDTRLKRIQKRFQKN